MSEMFNCDDIGGTCSRFIHVPLCYQETEFTCGVACTQSILAYYGIHYSQTSLANILHSQPILGTDFETILFFAQLLGFHASMRENMEICDIRQYIDQGITPILIIQAWKDDQIDYAFDWKDALYIIACGYNDNGIFVMDPYTLGNYTYLPFGELENRWHAVAPSGQQHFRSGLIIYPTDLPIAFDPKQIKPLK